MIAAAPCGASLCLLWLGFARRTRWDAAMAAAILAMLVRQSIDAPALAATIVVEAVVVFGLAFALAIDRLGAVLICGLVNVLTQPLLYVSFRTIPAAGGEHFWLVLGAAEAVVVIVEAGLYRLCLPDLRRSTHPLAKGFALSLAANAASTVVGLALPF